jgi:hypothetical protein
LHTTRRLEAAAAVLHKEVLPFYEQNGLRVSLVLTDHGTEFCGTEGHPYELYLQLNEIEHRRTKVATQRAWMNGSLDYYNNQRPHQGYRKMGKRPIDTFNQYIESVQIDD